ncbi:MAG: PLP-dependent aminotransferase family protein [Leifsonia sp.]
MDLHLEVGATRRAAAVETALRTAIRDGRLTAGTRLPPSRSLAADLGIARNSIAEVYARLVAEGWLEARVGSGTWVGAGGWVSRGGGESSELGDPPAAASARAALLGSAGYSIDFRGGLPDATGFPRAAWASATRRALSQASAGSFGYGDPAGHAALRSTLAEYLARARGVWAEPDRIVVTHGFGELLSVVCRALAAAGASRVAVEGYGHESHRRIITAAGLEVVPVPVDGGGADVSALDGLVVDAVLLTPSHQFPTGVPLTAARRVDVVRWAERTGGVVIEDDYDGEFRFDRRNIGALQALAPEHVVYAGTASKSLAPAVGLAWGVVPSALRAGVIEQRLLLGASVDALAQLSLAAFIEAGHYDRNVRSLRTLYRERRERLEDVIGHALPGSVVSGMAAGLHCVLELPPGIDERRVEGEAASRGLRLEGLSRFAVDGASDGRGPAVVLGFGAPAPHRYDDALSIVVQAVLAATDAR